MMKTVLFALAILAAATAPHQLRDGATPQEVAAALQRKYDGIRDFSSDFVQRHEGGLLGRKREERGTVLVKKPGMMRWRYTSPEEKLFISDGSDIYFYVPANNQVTVSRVPTGEQAAAVQFLTGRGNLMRDFDVKFAEGGGSETYALRLTPKQPQNDYDWLEIVVDRKSLQINRLTAGERDGSRSTFMFTGLKENVGLADKTFKFTIPRGAEVVHVGSGKR
jgi:outer membrane lipoprotein carrier protein